MGGGARRGEQDSTTPGPVERGRSGARGRESRYAKARGKRLVQSAQGELFGRPPTRWNYRSSEAFLDSQQWNGNLSRISSGVIDDIQFRHSGQQPACARLF